MKWWYGARTTGGRGRHRSRRRGQPVAAALVGALALERAGLRWTGELEIHFVDDPRASWRYMGM